MANARCGLSPGATARSAEIIDRSATCGDRAAPLGQRQTRISRCDVETNTAEGAPMAALAAPPRYAGLMAGFWCAPASSSPHERPAHEPTQQRGAACLRNI